MRRLAEAFATTAVLADLAVVPARPSEAREPGLAPSRVARTICLPPSREPVSSLAAQRPARRPGATRSLPAELAARYRLSDELAGRLAGIDAITDAAIERN